jgi:NAD(P)-dependent dehydrogenase (short-subunit alcohol dehydrogenase family)
MNHPAFASNHVAVVTGAASGIGLAAAKRFAGLGMHVVLADLPGERLDKAARETAAISPSLPSPLTYPAPILSRLCKPGQLRASAGCMC